MIYILNVVYLRLQYSPLGLSPRLAGEFALLRNRFKVPPVSFLLFLLSCYIVCSRLGPAVNRAGGCAIRAFELERRILARYDQDGLRLFREIVGKFRVATRAPFPIVLFGRSSDKNLLQVTMGNRSSSSKVEKKGSTATQPSSQSAGQEERAVVEEIRDLKSVPQEAAQEKEEEEAGEGGGGGGGKDAEGEGGKEGEEEGASYPLPAHSRLEELRKDSDISLASMGSTMSLTEIGVQERLNPDDFVGRKVKFHALQPTIRTGDLALLYRRGQPLPNIAVFINHSETDPLFPLLLVKGKTKPLSKEKFCLGKPRFIHPITATTRIFYGDYDRVYVRYLKITNISVEDAMGAIDIVERIPFSLKERAAILAAESDAERSLIICMYMAAYYYKQLGVFNGVPDEVTPANFLDHLEVSEPIQVKLPHIKFGPMVHGEPPFLKLLVDGISPPDDIEPLPYNQVIQGLDTGDLVFFSGATSQGAIIKFFDHSKFSHIALILKAKYTSQLLIWEASTNHAKLVDVQSGHVQTGVEVLPLRNKVFSGWYDHVAIRRLQNMTPERRRQLYEIMLKLRKEWMGRPYEKNLAQLAVSAINPSDIFLSVFQNTHEDLSSLFCSELVAAAYQRMGLIKNDRPSNTYTPDDFSSSRDYKILEEGVKLGPEEYIELKFPPVLLNPQMSVY